MNSQWIKGTVLSLISTASCMAALPPPELVAARSEYAEASRGVAANLDPADLHTAGESLEAAERSFEKDGPSMNTRNLAYVARRNVETAEARAQTIAYQQDKDALEQQQQARQASALRRTSMDLAKANQQLDADRRDLASERQQREEAERRAAQATADLQKIATVHQEARGTVITLSGSVLFASAKSDLLPDAMLKLTDVANALATQDPDSTIVVEGHTDSQGAASFNDELSQRRAEAVRTFLVGHGIASDRVTARGFGSTRSVASNDTAEGRANNRRVEIVVKPPTTTASTTK